MVDHSVIAFMLWTMPKHSGCTCRREMQSLAFAAQPHPVNLGRYRQPTTTTPVFRSRVKAAQSPVPLPRYHFPGLLSAADEMVQEMPVSHSIWISLHAMPARLSSFSQGHMQQNDTLHSAGLLSLDQKQQWCHHAAHFLQDIHASSHSMLWDCLRQ